MNRVIKTLCAAACAFALTTLPSASHAFGVSGFGGKIGFGIPEDHDAGLTLGAHVEMERPGSRFHLLPNVNYWRSDGVWDLSTNLDGYYHFESEGQLTPYLGAGLGVHFIEDDAADDFETDLGANLFGGLRFPMSSSHLFLEGRLAVSEITHFALLGGITLHR